MIPQPAPIRIPLARLSPPVSQPAASFFRGDVMSCQHATQNDRLITYMKRHRKITRFEAFIELGITNLWARIAEIRKRGCRIDDKFITTDNGARVKKYKWLGERRRAA